MSKKNGSEIVGKAFDLVIYLEKIAKDENAVGDELFFKSMIDSLNHYRRRYAIHEDKEALKQLEKLNSIIQDTLNKLAQYELDLWIDTKEKFKMITENDQVSQ